MPQELGDEFVDRRAGPVLRRPLRVERVDRRLIGLVVDDERRDLVQERLDAAQVPDELGGL